MKKQHACRRRVAAWGLMLVSHAAWAEQLSISNVPLGTGAGISVRPNMMFILDDSGSMDSQYMPDYVAQDKNCPDSNADGDADDGCVVGDPPYSAAGFNTIYYNPAVRYRPPANSTGTDWSDASTSTPRKEPFSSTDTSTQTLTQYQNTAWCKTSSNTPSGVPATDTNCAYYPVGTAVADYPRYPDATYKYRRTYSGPPVYYVMSGTPQWCTDSTLASCQSKRDSSHEWPKFSAASAVTGAQAWRSFYVIQAGDTSGAKTIDIKYNGTSILAAPISVSYATNSKNNRNSLAAAVRDAITASGSGFDAQILQDDTSTGGSSCSSSNVGKCAQIKVIAPGGTTSTTNENYNGKSFVLDQPTGIDFKNATANLANGQNYAAASSGVGFTRYQIVSGQTYTKHSGRTDCTGSSCTYEQELQNFANWYSFYRKRMAMTKTAVSRAFSSVSETAPGAGFRIGLMTISAGASSSKISAVGDTTCWTANKALEVPIGDFNATNKATFYTNLFAIQTCSYTPLRGALARAGQIYAHTLDDGTVHDKDNYDPVQYSCQQNFAFLSTDGYWNSNIEGTSFGPKKEDASTSVGNQDGSAAAPYKDALNKSDTLADVAYYYYNTDLRSAMQNDVPKSGDEATHQRMVSFTMGLGVDGTLAYSPYYTTGGSADYNAILQGTLNWPDPIANTADQRIDDLWHAAVNGRGKYFSASNPDQVTSSLSEALAGVSAMSGSAAAAATSNLEPVAGDNYAYVASYVTQTWEGNLEAKTIDLNTGALAATSTWSAQSLLDSKAAETTVPAGASGPGSRVLYSYDGALSGTDRKFLLSWANAQAKGWDGSVTGKDYFDPAQLSQCSPIGNCPAATRANLFSYLMGGANTSPDPMYRARQHVLGDIVNSQPVYVKQPDFSYTDDGYSTYKATARDAVVYVGANDGFLHAFDADTGVERWAFLPATVVPSLYELAGTSYGHRYFVDGAVTVGDVKVGSDWKTILVGGLGSGGRAYYALDVTDPANPLALWEFTDGRMGYSYGNPIVTKLPSGVTSSSGADIGGKWVALITSGYNNGGTAYANHNGQGVLYVLDAYTGVEYFRLYACTNQSLDSSCAGSSASPSGFARINAWADNPSQNNTSLYVYGGDLEGNLWRFDMTNKTVFKVAETGEPITVKPELAEVQNQRAIVFGTGLFLQANDKSDQTKRSIYAIKDDAAATGPLQNVKTSGALVEQTLALVSGSTSQRTVTDPQPVDWAAKSGWFVELLEARERVNVDPKIQLGTLVIASNVPDDTGSSACTTGGHSWLNFLDVATGSFIVNTQSNAGQVAGYRYANALAVGINVVKLPNGKLITITTTSDNQHPVQETPVATANLPMRRISWRELLTK